MLAALLINIYFSLFYKNAYIQVKNFLIYFKTAFILASYLIRIIPDVLFYDSSSPGKCPLVRISTWIRSGGKWIVSGEFNLYNKIYYNTKFILIIPSAPPAFAGGVIKL